MLSTSGWVLNVDTRNKIKYSRNPLSPVGEKNERRRQFFGVGGVFFYLGRPEGRGEREGERKGERRERRKRTIPIEISIT